MINSMASKRNSRAFVDESTHITEGQTTPNGTQFRSRHGSRSTSKEEVKQEMEEALSTMSRTPSFTAVAMEASLSTSTSDSDSRCTFYASQIHHGTFTDMTIASSISPPMSTDGRPFNFGVVIPGVYRSSFPKSHDFEYIKGLGLKTIVLVTHLDIS